LVFWPSVVCLVRDDAGRLLLVRHVEGWWSLPGGAIDPGESPAEAARREAREEASVEVELLGLAGVFGGYPDFHGFYANGDEVAWVTTAFDATSRLEHRRPATTRRGTCGGRRRPRHSR